MEITPARRPTNRAQSPTVERMEEKRVMNELNSRLGNYIQHVQELSTANDDLKRRLEDARSNTGAPNRKIYEDQIKQLRQELEENKRDKAMVERDLRKKTEDAAKAAVEKDDLAKELKRMEDQKVYYEQKVPQLENQIAFLNRLLDDEQTQSNQKLREKEAEIEKLKNDSLRELVARLGEQSQKLKQEAESARIAMQEVHADALRRLEDDKAATDVENANLRVQNTSLGGEIEVLQNKIAELQKQNKTLQGQVDRLLSDRDIDRLRAENSARIQGEEVIKLRAELGNMKLEFSELSSAKVALDSEIQSYRRLLAVGETALGQGKAITYPEQPQQPAPSSSKKRPAEDSPYAQKKVPRFIEAVEAGAAETLPFKFINSKRGIVNIEELNPQGQYIRISNMTSSEINLSNWWIQIGLSGVGTREVQPKRFKFPIDSTLPAEDSIKVLVKITDDMADEEGANAISFSSSMIQPGAFIQLFNDADELISQVDLQNGPSSKEEEGAFDRVCLLM